MKLPVYLDNNATTPVDPRVLDAMLPYLKENFGNAASTSHSFGHTASQAVEHARQAIANLLHTETKEEIVFTSGATESDNLAIKGVAEKLASKGKHIITCTTEHKAVLDPCKYLESKGYEVTWLAPDKYGRVSVQQVAEAIRPDTILITLMLANNEIGTLHPIKEIGAVAHERGVIFHTDATQAVGKLPIDVRDMHVDLLSMSGHKLYAPKGIGALYVRRRNPVVQLVIQMHGGGHERNMRSGTLNVPGIVALGKACEIAAAEMTDEHAKMRKLRDRLEKGLMSRLKYVKLNGHPTERLANTSNLSFAYAEAESIFMRARDIAVSSGSACTSATLKHSYVLDAIGVSPAMANCSLRISLGRFNDEADVDYAVEKLARSVQTSRDLNPDYETHLRLGILDENNPDTWMPSEEQCKALCGDKFCCRRNIH